ncbi:hypothetical protein ACNOYE_34385 [Nannocystaceae bacterium ST9]
MASPRSTVHASTLLACAALLAAASTGCFKPDEDGDDEIGDETATDTGTDGTSSTDSDSTDTSDAPMPIPPSIDVFTVAGSETPAAITAAGAVAVVVEASDADGEIAMVELLHDGEVFATIPAPGPYTGEVLIGGEAFDGDHEFTARAVDDDGLDVTAGPISLSVDVPNGGLVETWTFDGAEDDLVHRVWTNPEGSEVLAGGVTYAAGVGALKIGRVVGEPWADVGTNPSPASGIVGLPSGDYVAVSWDNANASVRYRYDSTGTQTAMEVSDWTPPNVPPESFEAPLDLATDDAGNFYATGIFATGQGFDTFMLRKFKADGSEDWKVYGSNPMTYPVPPYAVRMDAGADTVVVAGQLRQAEPAINRIWMARFGTNGGLLGQTEVADFEGTAWAVGIGDQGDVVLGGSRFADNGNQAWVARYDANDTQMWTVELGNTGIGATIAADIDPFGDAVIVNVVDCDGGFIATTGCDLEVRKYDVAGNLVWEQLFSDDLFLGPALIPLGGDLHFDRYGYAYVAVSHGNMTNADWWITKFNP